MAPGGLCLTSARLLPVWLGILLLAAVAPAIAADCGNSAAGFDDWPLRSATARPAWPG